MTDYEEGRYYGWNGGECPVHPKTKVAAWFADGDMVEALAEDFYWSGSETCNIPIVFHVVKKYVEPVVPKEVWLIRDDRSGRILNSPVSKTEREALSFIPGYEQFSAVKFVEEI